MNAIRLRIWAIYQNARNETMKAMSEARCNPFRVNVFDPVVEWLICDLNP